MTKLLSLDSAFAFDSAFELILSYRSKPNSRTFCSKYSSMCEEAYRIFNLPQEDAAVVKGAKTRMQARDQLKYDGFLVL